MSSDGTLPLAGVRVIEFGQLIMGPVAGLILADLGADVIKVEPAPAGDPTRGLEGFTSGFFDYFNRNKRSVAIDLKHPASGAAVAALLRDADVLIENFAPHTMERLGLGVERVVTEFPRIVYCALKGFLPGPYQERTALDEVVQFMGGLAYMTGPRGRPLRAGTSVVDLMGGSMAATGILAALKERDRTGRGQLVQTGLFESVAFMMGQHMAAVAIIGEDLPPMPEREGGWAIYRSFVARDGRPVFVAVTSDASFRRFCDAFERADLATDPRLATNALRLEAQPWLIPQVEATLAVLSADEIGERCHRARVPFAQVATAGTLFDDPHLRASGALLDVVVRGGTSASLPGLPLRLDDRTSRVHRQPPRIGEHSREALAEGGLAPTRIDELVRLGVVRQS